jgi:hypothetical protein
MFLITLALLLQVGVPPQPACDGENAKSSDTHPGFVILSGWMLTELDGKEYAVEYLCRDNEALIVLQLLLGRKDDGLPIWKTLAERKIVVPKGDGFLEGGMCKLKGAEDIDSEIVPIGHYTSEGAAKVTRAYRVNRARKAVMTMSAVKVECEVLGD